MTPPGLRNQGQNVCFLNAIMQAIAHTPCLPDAVQQLRRQNPVDRLVYRFSELLEQLAAPVSTSIPLVLDTRSFRTQAALEFPRGLIQHPFQTPKQSQQDAAECLTWLVEWLHARMNNMSPRGTTVSSVHMNYSVMTAVNLRQKYDAQPWQVTADQRSAAIHQVSYCIFRTDALLKLTMLEVSKFISAEH